MSNGSRGDPSGSHVRDSGKGSTPPPTHCPLMGPGLELWPLLGQGRNDPAGPGVVFQGPLSHDRGPKVGVSHRSMGKGSTTVGVGRVRRTSGPRTVIRGYLRKNFGRTGPWVLGKRGGVVPVSSSTTRHVSPVLYLCLRGPSSTWGKDCWESPGC